MIYTITLNPSFDQTIICENFQINKLNRALETRRDIGGKGINVSKIVKVLGGKQQAHGLLPQKGSEEFLESMLKAGLEHSFVLVPQKMIRTNLKIIDQATEEFTELNQAGPELAEKNLDLLVEKLLKVVSSDDLIVLSGSIPTNFPAQTYKNLIKIFKQQACKVILDVDGRSLQESISAAPFLIKPNLFELEQLVGKKITSLAEIEQATNPLLDQGIEHILVSLGSKGSFYSSKQEKIYIQPLKVEVKSPVGAGDSQVAAFAYGIENNLPIQDILKLTCATSTAMVQTTGTTAPEFQQIKQLIPQVKLDQFDELAVQKPGIF